MAVINKTLHTVSNTEYKELAHLIAECLSTDPGYQFIFGQKNFKAELVWLYKMIMKMTFLQDGIIQKTINNEGKLQSAIIWNPPAKSSEERGVKTLMKVKFWKTTLAFKPGVVKRLFTVLKVLAEWEAKYSDSWRLNRLVVHPSVRIKEGIEDCHLMNTLNKLIDPYQRKAYLFTADEDEMLMYIEYGFEIADQRVVSASLTLYCMVRLPKTKVEVRNKPPTK